LVNSIAGEEPIMRQFVSFWKTNLKDGEAVFRQALLSHIITAKHAALTMIRQRSGLIVEVTENDIAMAGGNPLSQSVKLALKGLALSMAAELRREYGCTDVDGRRPDWGAIDIDFSRLPPSLLEYMRTGAEIQLKWLDSVTRRTKRFLTQLPGDSPS